MVPRQSAEEGRPGIQHAMSLKSARLIWIAPTQGHHPSDTRRGRSAPRRVSSVWVAFAHADPTGLGRMVDYRGGHLPKVYSPASKSL